MPLPAQPLNKISPQEDTAAIDDVARVAGGVSVNPTAIVFDLELQTMSSTKGAMALVSPEKASAKTLAPNTVSTRLRLSIDLIEKLECLPDLKTIHRIPKILLEKAPKALEITEYSVQPETKLSLGFYGLFYQKSQIFCVYSNIDISSKNNISSKLLYLIKLKNNPHFWLIAGTFDYE